MDIGEFYIVDVFAERPYSGNRLAVVRASDEMSAENMQAIALEFNFSETSFIISDKAGEGGYPVRIFTPRKEVPFAGHPTLGTAWVLQNAVAGSLLDEVKLDLRGGSIPVTFQYEEGNAVLLTMEQGEPRFGESHSPGDAAAMFGISEELVDPRFPIKEVSTGLPFIIVPLRDLEALKTISVDLPKYYGLIKNSEAKAVVVFCPYAREAANHISMRMFADYYGIPEDPATGSAAGCLAAYLLKYNCLDTDSVNVRAEQGHAVGRPSLLHLQAFEKDNKIKVFVGGRVVSVAKGRLMSHKSA